MSRAAEFVMPWMVWNTLWSWLMTSLLSMRVTMAVEAEPRVMGMASFSSRERMAPLRSGTSVARPTRFRRLRKKTTSI